MSELARLYHQLQAKKFKVAHVPVDPGRARWIEHLLYIAGQDDAGNNIMLTMSYLEDIELSESSSLEQGESNQWGSTLLFKAALCSQVYLEQLADLNHLCAIINRSCPIGSFAASRGEGLYFQYRLIGPNKSCSFSLVAYVLEHISVIVEQFRPVFQSYLSKEQSLTDLFSDLGVLK